MLSLETKLVAVLVTRGHINSNQTGRLPVTFYLTATWYRMTKWSMGSEVPMPGNTTLFTSGTRRPDGAFISVDMLLLLAILVVFLVGVVALTAAGVSSFQSAKGSARVQEEAGRLMDRIEAMVSGARAVSPGRTTGGPFDFVADLDGSGGQVRAAADASGGTVLSTSGLEMVSLYRSSTSSRRLLTAVRGSSSGSRVVVLTSMLDPADPRAFGVECLSGTGRRVADGTGAKAEVGEVRVTVRLASGGESRSFTRLVHLSEPALLLPVSELK